MVLNKRLFNTHIYLDVVSKATHVYDLTDAIQLCYVIKQSHH